MIEFRRLTHKDYDDIIDISKDIWGGTDYLPKVFHKWIDDKGYFLGAVDASKNKVVAVGKFSILLDKSGWLEGLRVHKDYRGLKIARDISEKLINIAKQFKAEGKINKIAFGTYIDNKESIALMKKLGFKLEQSFHLFSKQYEDLNTNLSLKDFNIQSWDLSYDDFLNLPYIKKRDNLVDLAFVFQEPTRALYDELKADGAFITINGHNGIFKVKGEPNFAVEDDSFEAINTFMNYCLLKYKDLLISTPLSSITYKDKATIEQLKEANFDSWSDWQLDYLYYVLR